MLNINQLIGPIPIDLMNLTCLSDYRSSFCDNYLFTDNDALRDFLDTKQDGGDWESCQYSLDLSVYASTFGSTSSESNYDSSCDTDQDGDVDGNDLASFAAVI